MIRAAAPLLAPSVDQSPAFYGPGRAFEIFARAMTSPGHPPGEETAAARATAGACKTCGHHRVGQRNWRNVGLAKMGVGTRSSASRTPIALLAGPGHLLPTLHDPSQPRMP
jgi:hypothetical protein